jgi:WD40 repeat protein
MEAMEMNGRQPADTLLFALLLSATLQCVAQVPLKGHANEVRFLAFLPDGKTLMSGAQDSSIRLWDVPEGKPRAVWQQVPKFDAAPSTVILCLSGNGRLLARAGTAQGSAEIWDVARVANVRTIQSHQRPVYGVALSANGSVLVTFSQDELKVWDLDAGRNQVRMKAPDLYSFRAAAISPDGKIAAASTSDKKITLIDVVAAKQITQLEGGPGQLHALAFSPDGTFLASGSDGGPESSVKLWDVASLALVAGTQGSSEYARALAFSPDGRMLASGGLGVRVWHIDQRKVVYNFSGHSQPVRAVAFSPDGTLLASGSEDWMIGLWRLTRAP